MRKRVYKIKIELVQKGWVQIKAESKEAAERLAQEVVGGDLNPITVHEDEHVVDYDVERADIFINGK